jgi:hypothetical protein
MGPVSKLEIVSAANLESYRNSFDVLVDVSARLPEVVFRRRTGYKFVFGHRGGLNRVEVFERLAERYKDKALRYLSLDPSTEEIAQLMNTGGACLLPFGANFASEWKRVQQLYTIKSTSRSGIPPWVLASVNCYMGSSEIWASYEENVHFELDVFFVPQDCDVGTVFGEFVWTFEDVADSVSTYRLSVSRSELEEFRRNYCSF